MRLHFLRQTFVALIVLLTINLPPVTVAQQSSVHPEAQAAITEDTESMRFAAKTAAEGDATRDVNQLLWFGAGIGIAVVCGGVGALGGCVEGSSLNPEMAAPFGGACIVPSPNREQVVGTGVGTLIGASIGGLVSLIGSYSYPSKPPTQRFIGKSPAYIEFYTKAYTRKTRWIRTRSAAAGVAACFGIPRLGYLVFQDL